MQTRTQQDANKNATKSANNRKKHEPKTNYKDKKIKFG